MKYETFKEMKKFVRNLAHVACTFYHELSGDYLNLADTPWVADSIMHNREFQSMVHNTNSDMFILISNTVADYIEEAREK